MPPLANKKASVGQQTRIFLSENTGFVSRLIRFIRLSTFSHSGVIRYGTLTFEVVSTGVVQRSWIRRYVKKKNMAYEIYRINPSLQSALDKATFEIMEELTDTPYSGLQILGFFFMFLWKSVTGNKITNPVADGRKGLVCSELVFYILKRAGKKNSTIKKWLDSKAGGMDPDSVAPDHIWEWLADEEIWERESNRGY